MRHVERYNNVRNRLGSNENCRGKHSEKTSGVYRISYEKLVEMSDLLHG